MESKLKRSQVIVREVVLAGKGGDYKVKDHYSKIVGDDDGKKIKDQLVNMKSYRDRKEGGE